MATLIKSDGTRQENYADITLCGMQSAVGGYIELVYLADNKMLVVNEEGAIRSLSRNVEASQLASQTIVGDVLLMNQNEID